MVVAAGLTDYKYQLLLNKKAQHCVLESAEIQNRRLPPRTLLKVFRDAKLEWGETGESSPLALHLTLKDYVFLYQGKDVTPVCHLLKDVLAEKKITSITAHGTWKENQFPSQFRMEQKLLVFKPQSDLDVVEACAKCSALHLFWIMKVVNGSGGEGTAELAVYGMGLANAKQLTILPSRNILN